jgi:hypothetical protein
VIYSNNGSNSQYGIQAANRTNSTIRNCVLVTGSSSGSNHYGIELANNNNSLIQNNTILTNGSTSNYGLDLSGSNNNSIYSNILNPKGSGGFSHGMLVTSSSHNNRVINNSITTLGSSTTNRGIASVSSTYNIYEGNNVTAGGTTGADGIYLTSSNSHNRIVGNRIISNGTGGFTLFISTSSLNNTVSNNSITLNSGSGYVLYLGLDAYNSVFENNNFTSVSQEGVGISLSGSFSNNFTNNFVNISNVSNYEYVSSANSSTNSTNNRFANLTFVRNNVTASFVDFHTRIISLNASSVNADPSGLVNISKYLNVSNVSASSWIALNISYTDADISSRNIVENSLRIWKYNQTAWINSSFYNSYGVDTSNNIVYANITNFSDFGVLGETFSNVSASLTKTDSSDPLNISNTTLLTYQINFTVTNGTAYNVTINETYPSNTTFVNATPTPTTGNTSWNAGNITATNTYQINITVNVSSSLTNGTILTNTVNATLENSTGSTFQINVTENTTVVVNALPNETSITISKSDSPDPINLNTTTILNYNLTVTVTNGTAYNLNVTESYPSEVSFINSTPSPTSGNGYWFVGNMTTGQNYNISIYVNVSTSTPNGTSIINTMSSSFGNGTGGIFNISVSESTLVINEIEGQTQATLTKTDSPDPLNLSNTTILTYQINFTVTNNTAYNVTINDTYPGSVSFINSTPTPTTGNASWNAGNITTGSTYQINITVNVSNALSNGTILTNTVNTTYANATGSTLTANVQENTTIIKNLEFNATVISMTKIDAPDPVVAGQDLAYTININVTNGTAYNVTLTDVYPAQVSFVSATPANSTSDSWIVGNLTAGQNFQVNITVNVNSGTANGTVINNTANISYANSTGSILTLNVTAQTTVSTQSFPIVINNNTNITTNGTTTGPGIIINASNVTVSCNGNIITGSGGSVGVNITGFNNVTIQDCVFVNFATGAYIEDSNNNQFTRDTFRSVTNGINLLGTSQNSAFNHSIIGASSDWVFTSAASSGNVFQNTSYNDTGGQIIITPSVTYTANTNASQSRLDITSPEAFLNSSALPFLDVASQVTITGITNASTALILGDFDDDGTYEICASPQCSLISFTSGTAVFNTSGWTTYTIVDSGVDFTLSKTSSPDPVVPGNQVVYTITATVNSGFAQNITIVESPPAELTFVSSTPTNVSANTWLLSNLSAGQNAQINVTYSVNSSFTGTIQNNVSVTFQNSTNGTITTNISENTTAQFPSPSGGGGGGGGGSSSTICPPFCQYPENKDLPVCRNNCPPAQAPAQQNFGTMFPPVSEVAPPQIELQVEEPVLEEEPVVEETPVKKLEPVKGKLFPWWYILLAIIAIVFMIWETHHIVSKVHKPSKLNTKLEKVDKDIARMKKMLKKK